MLFNAIRRNAVLGTFVVASLASLAIGVIFSHFVAAGFGAAGLGYMGVYAFRVLSRKRRDKAEATSTSTAESASTQAFPSSALDDPNDLNSLIERMLAQGRYALLLREQVAKNLSPRQLCQIREVLFEAMTLVPDGEVVLGRIEGSGAGSFDDPSAIVGGRVVRVEHFLIDRYPITNQQYYTFVKSGGYEQVALWQESILPAVLDFVDQTGQPGPRYWQDGCYLPGREQHPVVGISWFEAAAYARWLGKRLPTGAEWAKAGSWPVGEGESRVQRRYPWGETMDPSRANLWAFGLDDTVPVDQFAEGASVGGACQLIGNVWEWTGGEFHGESISPFPLSFEVPVKPIRGGAFDTYFDNQATCHFESGEPAIARKHNVGFRCAVGACDLMLTESTKSRGSTASGSATAGSQPGSLFPSPAREVSR